MIRINEQYCDRFNWYGKEIVFCVMKGVYLAFDKNTLEYIGIETLFQPKESNWIQKKCDEKLNELLTRGILEYTT